MAKDVLSKVSEQHETDVCGRPPDVPEIDAKAMIESLAALSPVEYDRQRDKAAQDLGIRVSTLDNEVTKLREDADDREATSRFEDIEPWDRPVDGPTVLAETVAAFERFCVLPPMSAEAMALWVLHAHAHDAAQISPLLAVVSPEKRCGKTTVLSVVSAIVPKPVHSVNMSSAVLFRIIERHKPTALVDEGDTFLAENEELRGIVNGGHNALTAFVYRCVGDNHEPKEFSVWAPKAIAMIGRPHGTLEDRSVMVPLRRKTRGETVERFRADKLDQFTPLRRKLARFAADNFEAIAVCDPEVPETLGDRAADNWRTLIAIADVTGGDWPVIARKAAVVTSATAAEAEDESAGVMLLRDVREIMRARDRMTPTDLIAELINLPEAPWISWNRGRPITARRVAALLKPFGVMTSKSNGDRFYFKDSFRDAWGRYLDTPPQTPGEKRPLRPLSESSSQNQWDSKGRNEGREELRDATVRPCDQSDPRRVPVQVSENTGFSAERDARVAIQGVSSEDASEVSKWTEEDWK